MSTTVGVDGLEVTGPTEDRFDEVLSPRSSGRRRPPPRARTAAGSSGSPRSRSGVRALFREVAVSDEYSDFLTLPAYERMP